MKHFPSKSNHSGQAMLELLTMLLAFGIVMLGFIFVSGLSIANIEILLSAKSNAEDDAQHAVHGTDGDEISDWTYTTYYKGGNDTNNDGTIQVTVPFLARDHAKKSYADLANAGSYFNDSQTSEATLAWLPDYKFNSFFNLPIFTNQWNFGAGAPVKGSEAANLIAGRAGQRPAVATIDPNNSNGMFDQDDLYNLYESFRILTGTNLSNLELHTLPSNTVYMPALKVR